MKQVDTRGCACPEPVLMTKQALKGSPQGLTVLADNATAVGNVTRFSQNAGYRVHTEETGGVYTLTLSK